MDINNIWSGIDLSKYKQNTRCLSINTILAGKYLVGPILGQGGFGITYMGFDLNMETKVAIKEYFPVELVSRDTTTMHGDRVLSLSGEKSVTYQQGLKKYVAEAQNVSQFSEIPGVVSVKDFFYENETAYIVMEFIDGISLKDYLKEKGGRLSEEETLRVMKPVLEALVKVHEAGIIHRDISPDNIMMTFEEGSASGAKHTRIRDVKLIDFGAARMTAKNDQKSLTIILKHGYAPEEQYRTHGEQGPWTDVYAVCAVLYRMMTGETPVPAMDRMFQDDLKTLEQQNTSVSKHVSGAILKGLAVKKDDRIQNMQELIGALYEGKNVRISGTSGVKKKNWIAVGGAATAIAVVLGIGIGLLGGEGKSELPPEESRQESVQAGNVEQTQPTETTVMEIEIEEEDAIGEAIVARNPQTSVSARGNSHVLFALPDGTVQAFGSNDYGQCQVEDWTHIAAVSSGLRHSVGLRTDGTVVIAGTGGGQDEVESWTDVVAIETDEYVTYGLRADGTVLAGGMTDNEEALELIAGLKDIKMIAAGKIYGGLFALDHSGVVHIINNINEEGQRNWEFSGWDDVEYLKSLAAADDALVGICADGSVKRMDLYSGKQEVAEGEMDPEEVSQFAISSIRTYGVKKDGTVFGLDHITEMETWTDMECIDYVTSSGGTIIMGMKKDGTITTYHDIRNERLTFSGGTAEWIQLLVESGGNVLVRKTDSEIYFGDLSQMFGKYGYFPDLDYSQFTDLAGENAALLDNGEVYMLTQLDYQEPIKDPLAVNVKHVYSLVDGGNFHCAYVYLLNDGTLQFAEYPEGYSESFGQDLEAAKSWIGVKQIVGNINGIYGLFEDGTVRCTVSHEDGNEPEILAEGIVDIARDDNLYGVSKYADYVVGVKEDGTVEVIRYQERDEKLGRAQFYGWSDIVDVEVGQSHVVGLRSDGTVVAAGGNHRGQCDVEEWTDIVQVKAGLSCTVGLTKDGEVKVAGSLSMY